MLINPIKVAITNLPKIKSPQKHSLASSCEAKEHYTLPSYNTAIVMARVSFAAHSTSLEKQQANFALNGRIPLGEKLANGFTYEKSASEKIIIDYKKDIMLNDTIAEFEEKLNTANFKNNIDKLDFLMKFAREKLTNKELKYFNGGSLDYYARYNTPESMKKLYQQQKNNPTELYSELKQTKNNFQKHHEKALNDYVTDKPKESRDNSIKDYMQNIYLKSFNTWQMGDFIEIESGVCRHKTLLVKILADKVLSKPEHNIQCSIEGGHYENINDRHAWNMVKENNNFWILDAEQKRLILVDKTESNSLKKYLQPILPYNSSGNDFLKTYQANPDFLYPYIESPQYHNAKLTPEELQNKQFDNAIFQNCKLELENSDIQPFQNKEIQTLSLEKSSLTNISLENSTLKNSNLYATEFSNCEMNNTTFDNCSLIDTSFDTKTMSNNKFINCIIDSSTYKNYQDNLFNKYEFKHLISNGYNNMLTVENKNRTDLGILKPLK